MASVSKSSWHYRLHSIIRKMWGNPVRNGETRSLCPYFHITFWGTILTILCAPISVAGWVYCKFWRLVYKHCNNKKFLRVIPEAIDAIKFSDTLDNASDEFEKAPVKTGLKWFARAILFVATIVCAIMLISIMFFGGYKLIPEIPGLIVDLIYMIGQGIFWIFFGIGWLLLAIWDLLGTALSFVWGLLVDLYNWLVPMLSSKENLSFIGKWTFYIVSIILGSWIIGASVLFLATWSKTERIRAWFSIKANGYMTARKERADRLAQLQKEAEERAEKEKALQDSIDKWDEMERTPIKQNPDIVDKINHVIGSIFETIGDIAFETKKVAKNLYAKEVRKVDKDDSGEVISVETVKVLGPLGVLVSFLWAIKKGVCPILEFVDEEDLKADSDDKLTIKEKS